MSRGRGPQRSCQLTLGNAVHVARPSASSANGSRHQRGDKVQELERKLLGLGRLRLEQGVVIVERLPGASQAINHPNGHLWSAVSVVRSTRFIEGAPITVEGDRSATGKECKTRESRLGAAMRTRLRSGNVRSEKYRKNKINKNDKKRRLKWGKANRGLKGFEGLLKKSRRHRHNNKKRKLIRQKEKN